MLQVIADLGSLSWWRGPQIDDDSTVRLSGPGAARASRPRRLHHLARVEHPPRTPPGGPMSSSSATWWGRFHSPSRGAIDYVAALAMDPLVERIDLHHGGKIKPSRCRPISTSAWATTSRAGPVPDLDGQTRPTSWRDAIRKGPCTFHFWCEPTMAPHITIASRLGPTVMFTCGDEPPPQYADVFWYFHEPELHRADLEAPRRAASFTRNYVQSLSGPFYDQGPPAPAPAPRSICRRTPSSSPRSATAWPSTWTKPSSPAWK
jgi:hypothetical protein